MLVVKVVKVVKSSQISQSSQSPPDGVVKYGDNVQIKTQSPH